MSDLKWSVYPEIAGEPQTNLIANKATAFDELLHIARRRRWVRGRLVRFKIEVRSCFNCQWFVVLFAVAMLLVHQNFQHETSHARQEKSLFHCRLWKCTLKMTNNARQQQTSHKPGPSNTVFFFVATFAQLCQPTAAIFFQHHGKGNLCIIFLNSSPFAWSHSTT